MKLISEHPFLDYIVYRVWHNKEKRFYSQLINKLTKKRTTISYAKYLLSIQEGRILTREEEVDHIDGDKLNDNIENLQILTKEDNLLKYLNNEKTTKRKMVTLKCDYCNKEFQREERQVKHKDSVNNFCCKEHFHKFR